MDTDQLIDQLASEGPQKPLPRPMKQVLFWLAGTFVWLGATAWYSGFRSDLLGKLVDPLYITELGLLFGMAFSSAIAALCLSRPDGYQKPWVKYIPFAFILPWAAAAFSGATGDITFTSICHSMTLGQFDCPWHILLFSAPPGVVMFLIIKRGAPIQCYWAGSMATWSVTSFGYLCMRLVEQNDNPAHLIVWHALPIVLICMMGMMLGKILLRWR